jgi:hypothetical protein
MHEMPQEEVFKFCLETRNNDALPLDPACRESLRVHSLTILPPLMTKFTIMLVVMMGKAHR